MVRPIKGKLLVRDIGNLLVGLNLDDPDAFDASINIERRGVKGHLWCTKVLQDVPDVPPNVRIRSARVAAAGRAVGKPNSPGLWPVAC